MKPTILDPKSPKLAAHGKPDNSTPHIETSSHNSDSDTRTYFGTVAFANSETAKLGRKPRHNRISGEVRTQGLYEGPPYELA